MEIRLGRPAVTDAASASGTSTPEPRERRQLRVALVQLEIRDGRPSANLERATVSIRNAGPADLYVLPELWTMGDAHAACPPAADLETPAVIESLSGLAAECRACIAGSMISRNERGALVNRLWLVPPAGAPRIRYDKGHLFAPSNLDRDTGHEPCAPRSRHAQPPDPLLAGDRRGRTSHVDPPTGAS